ncbi:MAG: hypothetical protein IKS02_01670 [Fibrobacter sp.]|nr:hypothetical protein [Fibrobacter sp.]
MFYKHWKKIALTLTAFFWASCDDSSSAEAECLYGPPPEYQSSDSNDASSSATKVKNQSSSSKTKETSSASNKSVSSSSKEQKNKDSSSSEATEPKSSSSKTSKVKSNSSEEFFNPPVYGDEPVFGESSSSEVTCVPVDSSVAYFQLDYSAEHYKRNAQENAKHASVAKIDSIMQTLQEVPTCLQNLRMQLDMFVALYGAPTIITNAVESCSDGTTRPSEEYAKFLKMKEEWEKNKPALDEELKQIYDDKIKDIEQQVNQCLNSSETEEQKGK